LDLPETGQLPRNEEPTRLLFFLFLHRPIGDLTIHPSSFDAKSIRYSKFLKVEICDKAKENQGKRPLNLQVAAENKKSPFWDLN
jgi:hypothetical protein